MYIGRIAQIWKIWKSGLLLRRISIRAAWTLELLTELINEPSWLAVVTKYWLSHMGMCPSQMSPTQKRKTVCVKSTLEICYRCLVLCRCDPNCKLYLGICNGCKGGWAFEQLSTPNDQPNVIFLASWDTIEPTLVKITFRNRWITFWGYHAN